jgi:hypothetical protein
MLPPIAPALAIMTNSETPSKFDRLREMRQ